MSCLRLSRKKPESITKNAENSRTWCRCHYCRHKIQAGKSRLTISVLKFLTKLGLAHEMNGCYKKEEYLEEEYYKYKPNGLAEVLGENESGIMCMGEYRNPTEEADMRVTSKASSSSSTTLQLHGVDPMFDEFIEKNRERFRLEKDDSFERRNYYSMWPYLTYFDPNF